MQREHSDRDGKFNKKTRLLNVPRGRNQILSGKIERKGKYFSFLQKPFYIINYRWDNRCHCSHKLISRDFSALVPLQPQAETLQNGLSSCKKIEQALSSCKKIEQGFNLSQCLWFTHDRWDLKSLTGAHIQETSLVSAMIAWNHLRGINIQN